MAKNCYEDVWIDKSMYCFLIKFVLCLHGKAGPPSHISTMTILRENRAGAEWASPVKWASPANQAGSSHRNRFHRFSAFSRTRPDSFLWYAKCHLSKYSVRFLCQKENAMWRFMQVQHSVLYRFQAVLCRDSSHYRFRAGITLQTIQCGVNIAKHQKPIAIDSSYKNYQRWLNPAFTNTIPTEKRIIWYLLYYFK